MFWESLVSFPEIFPRIFQFFDGVGIFKGLKSHDSRSNQMKTWIQNVRKDVNFKTGQTKVLGAERVKFDNYFIEKNGEISAI